MRGLCGTADATTCLSVPLRCVGLASSQRDECGRSFARATRLEQPPVEARPSICCIPSRGHFRRTCPSGACWQAHVPAPATPSTTRLSAEPQLAGRRVPPRHVAAGRKADRRGTTRAPSRSHSAKRPPFSYSSLPAPAHPDSKPRRTPTPGHAPTPNAPTGIHAHTRHTPHAHRRTRR